MKQRNKYGLIGGAIVAGLVGTYVLLTGGPETLVPTVETPETLMLLNPSIDMGVLPSRDKWCSLARDAEHCWLLQEAAGDAIDTGSVGGWDLSSQDSPRRAVPLNVPVSDGAGGVTWDEVGIGTSEAGGGRMRISNVNMCDERIKSATVIVTRRRGAVGTIGFLWFFGTNTLQIYPTGDERDTVFLVQSPGSSESVVYVVNETLAPMCITMAVDTSDKMIVHINNSTVVDHDIPQPFAAWDTTENVGLNFLHRTNPVGTLYRARIDCGHQITLAEHQEICGSLGQPPSNNIRRRQRIRAGDTSFSHTGGERCFQQGAHSASCVPADYVPWAWSATHGHGWPDEPERTNRVLYSYDIDCTTWDCTDPPPTITKYRVAPDGTRSATLVETDDDVKAIFTPAAGYTKDTTLHLSLWMKCAAGTVVIEGTAGKWEVDCAVVDDEWEYLTADHGAVTVDSAFGSDGAGNITLTLRSDEAGGGEFLVWMPTLTQVAGLSTIPTAAAAVEVGGVEQAYTIEADSRWIPRTPDVIRLYGGYGILTGLEVRRRP